jgi:chloramphenicol 3-O phosphotransferase
VGLRKSRPRPYAKMGAMSGFGWIIILNGAPRSGKSSIVEVIQDTFDGAWMNLGVDVFARYVTPARYRPGMGLRPGGERPDIEALMPALYASFYDSVAAHSRHGLNVVVDVGHHDAYPVPLGLLGDSLNRLRGLPVLIVGVHCPVEVIMERRASAQPEREGQYLTTGPDGTIPDPVLRWQEEVHYPGIYDLEVDTSTMTPAQCAEMIRERLAQSPPSAASRVMSELGRGGPYRRE